MEYRHLGRSGLLVTEISYGNWLTHGSQVEEEQALACVRAALDNGITTFDTADVYARTKAESVLGRALKGERRDGRSEEHTSELQSRQYLVCRLLLEKKKKNIKQQTRQTKNTPNSWRSDRT